MIDKNDKVERSFGSRTPIEFPPDESTPDNPQLRRNIHFPRTEIPPLARMDRDQTADMSSNDLT